MVELKEPLATLWRGKDAFAEVKELNGEVFRELETRRTLRFELSGKICSHCGCPFWVQTESGMLFIA